MTGEKDTRFDSRGAAVRGEHLRSHARGTSEAGGVDGGVHGNTMPSALSSSAGRISLSSKDSLIGVCSPVCGLNGRDFPTSDVDELSKHG